MKKLAYDRRALWTSLGIFIAPLLAILVFVACTKQQRDTAEQEILNQAKTRVEACLQSAAFKACESGVFHQCTGATVVLAGDQCVTESTSLALLKCLESCEYSTGEAGAPGQ